MQTTYIDRVRRHARVTALLLLSRHIKTYPESATTLRLMSAKKFDEYFMRPEIRIAVACLLLNPDADASSTILASLASTSAQNFSALPGEQTFVPTDWLPLVIIDRSIFKLESDLQLVKQKWLDGVTLIDRVTSGKLTEIARCSDLICGLKGELNTIRAFSNIRIPGFIAFNVNASTVLVAEQILHESTHVALSATLALDTRYASLIHSECACFSPFTDSIRPVERVVHGIISYSAVLEFWKQLHQNRDAKFLHEAFGGRLDSQEIISRRLLRLNARIRIAILFLRDVLGAEEFNEFKNLFSDFFPEMSHILFEDNDRGLIIELAGYPRHPLGLSGIQQAEVMLARSGLKVSRISLSMQDIARVGFALAAEGPVIPASWVVSPVYDNNLGGFSNVVSAEKPILHAEMDDQAHLYIALNPETAREAAQLDLRGEAGCLLGIPACCRAWFSKRWDSCQEQGGDLLALLLRERAHNGQITLREECDASAMFRGGGLCWHFPCEPDCVATMEIVRERKEFLASNAPNLLSELMNARVNQFWLDRQGRYLFNAPQGDRSEHIHVLVK